MDINFNLDQKEEYNRRYESMMNSDFGMTTKDFQHFDVINFDNYNHYNVEVLKKGRTKARCDCPDFCTRGRVIGVPCKHILYVLSNYERYKTLGEEIYEEIMNKFKNNIKED